MMQGKKERPEVAASRRSGSQTYGKAENNSIYIIS